MMTREEIKTIYDAGPEAVTELVEGLLQQIAQLTARVSELERQLGQNSRNSSKPPAGDGPRKPPRSLREKSGRKAGGQPGHRGQTLRQVEQPDQVVTHSVASCTGCGADLQAQPPTACERRQVFDLPPLKLEVTEHQVESKTCAGCGAVNQAAFPDAVTQPVQYGPRVQATAVYLMDYQLLPFARTSELLGDLFGQALAPGTLFTAQQACAQALVEPEERIKECLRQAAVLHVDETGCYVGGQREWLHVASTGSLTHYAVHAKRGAAATDEINILPPFAGVAVHDAWSPYWKYDCEHALCNAPHLRELTAVAEPFGQPWAVEMKTLLCEIKQTVQTQREAGREGLDAQTAEPLLERYDRIIAQGLEENPLVERVTAQRGRVKQSKPRNLLDRLKERRVEALRFMTDCRVPFDNNQAERALRMTKVQQKISGCFRSRPGAEAFCRIRSYISTVRKHGLKVLSAIESVFNDRPFMPASPQAE